MNLNGCGCSARFEQSEEWEDADANASYKQSLGIFTFHDIPTLIMFRTGQLMTDDRLVSLTSGEHIRDTTAQQ